MPRAAGLHGRRKRAMMQAVRAHTLGERRREYVRTATARATARATADAGDHAGGWRWMAPHRCRAASACDVPPQPAIARPGGGWRPTEVDRGRRRGQKRAGAAL